ncbi:MAG: right-handed parallel beta-helix repeat-containing protein [Bacteroidales bacterium]|nr:right-handed parallel beta-helix repeat-containing protein [Bacteroidales bacterium]
MKISQILLLCLLFTLHTSLAQQVIYVDASNNTGIEDGTMAHPFNTILEGLQLSQNGDSISVFPGNYPEDPILIEKCVSIAGESRFSTMVEGRFILSSKLDTLLVLIRNLWCENIMHSDSGYTQTPLSILECGLQVLNDNTPSVSETGRIVLKNSIVTDSIHIESASCAARREVIDCETGAGLWVCSTSSDGLIRLEGNQVTGSLRVRTVSKSDTIFITGNTISDSLVILSTASDPDLISNNQVGGGIRMYAVAHSGFRFTGNQVQQGSLSATYTALSESVIEENTFLNGGINFKAIAGDIKIKDNEIHTDGSVAGIRLKTTAGGYFENNTITLPYFESSGLPFEEDTLAVCAIHVRSTSFGGMKGNKISGGAYGVYLSAIASNEFDKNEIEDSHFGLYLQSVSGYVDSNRVEYCIGDGMVLDYQPEYGDTNAIRLNYNIIRNNGGHGIWTKGNCPMGSLKEPGTGYNIIKDNGGYDLYVETSAAFVDTIWAQNNEWSHDTEEEVGQFDIYDAMDDPSRALVMFEPIQSFSIEEYEVTDIMLYPNPTHSKVKLIFDNWRVSVHTVEIMDISGKIMKCHKDRTLTQRNNGVIEIDISLLPPGIYFCRVQTNGSTSVKKLIKL